MNIALFITSDAAIARGVNPGGLGDCDPQILGRGSCRLQGVVEDREMLYLMMYRKYVRKW